MLNQIIKRTSAALLLLLTTLAFSQLFLFNGMKWETDTGLEQLYHLRGSQAPPDDILIITLDKSSAEQLDLELDAEKWSREIHAQLINKLSPLNPSAIAFDIFFQQLKSPQQDLQLARALADAKNVVLFARLNRNEKNDSQGINMVNIEQLQPPAELFLQNAAAIAPFVLAKVPVRVDQFWAFQNSAGDVPTLPVVALAISINQHLYLLNRLRARITAAQKTQPIHNDNLSNLNLWLRDYRNWLSTHPTAVPRLINEISSGHGLGLSPLDKKRLLALIHCLAEESRLWLNFYGPQRTIKTINYTDVLYGSISKDDVQNKIIFVGHSENRQPYQKDGFHTVYSQSNGVDLSGVEIGATASANLINRNSLTVVTSAYYFLILTVHAFVITFLNRHVTLKYLVFALAGLAGGYLVLSAALFAFQNIWLPWQILLYVQTPVALIAILLFRYSELQIDRKKIRQSFGYYLPDKIVDRIIKHADPQRESFETLYGICLASDAAQYTAMAEDLAPEVLAETMNQYYEHLFQAVENHQGIVIDIAGDGMMAIWVGDKDKAELRNHACQAALEIFSRLNQLKNQKNKAALATRIGIHAGYITLGHIGTGGHYEYRAFGDIVNTSNRIEQLGKRLQCRLIVSAEVAASLSQLPTRELGQFLLPGKKTAITLYELLDPNNASNLKLIQNETLLHTFDYALKQYQDRHWQQAEAIFQKVLIQSPDDGPSHFYLHQCQQQLTSSYQQSNGIIDLA